jgi:hypothetical protein
MGLYNPSLSVEENQANWASAAEFSGNHLVPGGVAPGPDLDKLALRFQTMFQPDGAGGAGGLDLSGVLASTVTGAVAGAAGSISGSIFGGDDIASLLHETTHQGLDDDSGIAAMMAALHPGSFGSQMPDELGLDGPGGLIGSTVPLDSYAAGE